jgi:hypothetical protein
MTLAVMLALAVILAVRGPCQAAPLDPKGQDWEGLSQLVALAQAELGTGRVTTPTHLDLSLLQKEDALFLVHPTAPLDVDELSTFMRAGGRIVILDDYGTGDELLARFGIRRVPLPSRPAEMLRDNPALALAEPASNHAAVRDVGRVVTNHATGLDHKALSAVLVVRGQGEPDVLLSVAGAVGKGRLLAVGDSSLLMNSMLRYPGNRALGADLVRYATEDDAWGRRDGKLVVLANDFTTTGSFGTDSRVGGALGGVVGEAWRTAQEALETLRRDGMPPLAAYLLALAVGLGVVGWTSTRAGHPHRALAPRFVKPAPLAAQGGVAGRAAVLAAPGTARMLAMLEMKNALEEEVATRLGLDRAPPAEELAKQARAAGLLDAQQAEAMARLLKRLGEMEIALSMQKRRVIERVRDADVAAVAARVRDLMEAVGAGHA